MHEAIPDRALSFDGTPGGLSNRTRYAVQSLESSGLGTLIGPVHTDHTFIPTVSALGLDLDPGTPIAELEISGPFDRIYWEERNRPHLGGSQDGWIQAEIAMLVGEQ